MPRSATVHAYSSGVSDRPIFCQDLQSKANEMNVGSWMQIIENQKLVGNNLAVSVSPSN